MKFRNFILFIIFGIFLVATSAEAAGKNVSSISKDGHLLVDGEPFFVIGMYSTKPSHLEILGKAGFNVVHNYIFEHSDEPENDDMRKWLDEANRNQLKCLVGMPRQAFWKGNMKAFECRVKAFRNHPALLGWQLQDEPDGAAKSKVKNIEQELSKAAALVKKNDPDHFVTTVVLHFGAVPEYVNRVDLFQFDYYPVPPLPAKHFTHGSGMEGVATFCDLTIKHSDKPRPFWYVGQGFDYVTYKRSNTDNPDSVYGGEVTSEWDRQPSKAEIKSMAYTSVACGARGVLFWGLCNMMDSKQTRSTLHAAEMWADTRETSLEMHSLLPVLNELSPRKLLKKSKVRMLLQNHKGKTFAFISNPTRKEAKVEFTISGLRNGKAENIYGTGKYSVRQNRLTLDLAPLDYLVLTFPQTNLN